MTDLRRHWPTATRLDEMELDAKRLASVATSKMDLSDMDTFHAAVLEVSVAGELLWMIDLIRRAGLSGPVTTPGV